MSKPRFLASAIAGLCLLPASSDAALTNLWRLNDGAGSVAVDSVGGVNGTVNNSATGGQGFGGSAWVTNDAFRGIVASGNGNDASGAFVSAGSRSAAQMNGNFTWTYWAALGAGTGGNDVVIGNRFGGPGWAKGTQTKFEWAPSGGAGTTGNADYADIPTDDGWRHYAIVKNGTSFTTYQDGVQTSTGNFTRTFSGAIPFFMGGDSGGERIGGRMSDVAVFDQALTQEQILNVRTNNYTEFGVGSAPEYFIGSATAVRSSGVFAVASDDILQGLTPTVTGAAITARESTSGNAAVLTNGIFGAANKNGAPLEIVTIDDNTVLTYQLDLSQAPTGYTIDAIRAYSGWNDTGRDEQDFTVQVAFYDDPLNFVAIGDVVFNPGGANPSNIFSELTNPLGGPMAFNVSAIRFAFGTAENGYIGYRELDVLGFATVPEPATASLALMALSAMGLRRRRA